MQVQYLLPTTTFQISYCRNQAKTTNIQPQPHNTTKKRFLQEKNNKIQMIKTWMEVERAKSKEREKLEQWGTINSMALHMLRQRTPN